MILIVQKQKNKKEFEMNKLVTNKIIGILCLLLIVSIHSLAQIDPGKDFDLQGFIDQELAKGKKEIREDGFL